MTSQIRSAIDFYDRHPISAQTILAKLGAVRGTLEGLQPDDLFPHDQDHYGGLAANDALAKCADIGVGTKVVDLCAGLGGPARYLAHRYGAMVIGVELTPARVAGAAELTQRVGLSGQVRITEGNVMDLPLPDASQDASSTRNPCSMCPISGEPSEKPIACFAPAALMRGVQFGGSCHSSSTCGDGRCRSLHVIISFSSLPECSGTIMVTPIAIAIISTGMQRNDSANDPVCC